MVFCVACEKYHGAVPKRVHGELLPHELHHIGVTLSNKIATLKKGAQLGRTARDA